jgi:STE24 endopeptidase
MSIIGVIVLVLITLHRAASLGLLAVQGRHVNQSRGRFPRELKGLVDKRTFARSLDYTLEKTRSGVWGEVVEAAAVLLLLFSGGLPWAYIFLMEHLGHNAFSQALFILLPFALVFLVQLPLDAWRTFHVETRYGFNHSGPALWLVDQVKSLLVYAVVLYPLILSLLGVSSSLGSWWWLAGFLLLAAFQVLLVLLFPRVILPLFHKFTPLKSGPLKTRLLRLAARLEFGVQGLFVMDGSRRSAHSNAFFTGWGRFRRVVLFDTLIKQLSIPELEATLAHEIGHYKHSHVAKSLLISLITSFLGFALVRLLQLMPQWGISFGFPEHNLAVVLVLLMLVAGSVLFWTSPLTAALSRRWEYQADAFAARHSGAGSMASALRKLQQKNLGNYAPHPWVVAFYYSHPPLVERLRRLKRKERNKWK